MNILIVLDIISRNGGYKYNNIWRLTSKMKMEEEKEEEDERPKVFKFQFFIFSFFGFGPSPYCRFLVLVPLTVWLIIYFDTSSSFATPVSICHIHIFVTDLDVRDESKKKSSFKVYFLKKDIGMKTKNRRTYMD